MNRIVVSPLGFLLETERPELAATQHCRAAAAEIDNRRAKRKKIF
jgi:hypothetical protein